MTDQEKADLRRLYRIWEKFTKSDGCMYVIEEEKVMVIEIRRLIEKTTG